MIREGTSAILQKDDLRRNTVLSIIKKHFKAGSVLQKDLECYKSLYENQGLPAAACQKIIKEARIRKNRIDANVLFEKQTSLIHDINKHIESSLFNNFVPNYKSLANIYQLFSDNSTPRDVVLLEQIVAESMSASSEIQEEIEVDDIVVDKFISKFNDKYDKELLPEQKELLNLYIKSFVDNSLEFKIFLNEEVARLKKGISEATKNSEFVEDEEMTSKAHKVIEKLSELTKTEINEDVILTVLRTQSLIEETSQNGDCN